MRNEDEKFLRKMLHGNSLERRIVAWNQHINFEMAMILVKDDDKNVRLCLSSNIMVHPSILDILSEDVEYDVRENVARNKNTSIDTLKKLSKSYSSDVSNAALDNLFGCLE